MMSLHQEQHNFNITTLQVQEIVCRAVLKRTSAAGVKLLFWELNFNFLWFNVSYPKSYKVHLVGTEERLLMAPSLNYRKCVWSLYHDYMALSCGQCQQSKSTSSVLVRENIFTGYVHEKCLTWKDLSEYTLLNKSIIQKRRASAGENKIAGDNSPLNSKHRIAHRNVRRHQNARARKNYQHFHAALL